MISNSVFLLAPTPTCTHVQTECMKAGGCIFYFLFAVYHEVFCLSLCLDLWQEFLDDCLMQLDVEVQVQFVLHSFLILCECF